MHTPKPTHINPVNKDAARFDRRSTSPNVNDADLELACKLFFPNETIQHCQELSDGFGNINFLIKIDAIHWTVPKFSAIFVFFYLMVFGPLLI